MAKVLIVATSRKTRGGITAVIKAHETGKQWKSFHCKWIETHRDGNAPRKLWYLFTAFIEYILLLPFYDIVHIHIATPQSAKRKQLFFYPAKWMKKKTIFHFHPSNEKFLFEPNNQKLYYRLFSQADLILVLSEQWRKWLKEALNISNHVEVLFNPCPIVNRTEDLRERNILFAGTIIPRKGYADLIKAFSLIASQHPDWKIIFAGNGEIEKAKKLAIECGISNQTIFLGWVNGRAKDLAFQKASIYCLASNGEGFPMGVLDAWAYGIPCIVTPVGGIPDIIKDGVNGLIYPIEDYHKLADKLNTLISNDQLRREIVKQSDKYVNQEFKTEHICQKLSNIYNSLSGIRY